MLKNLMILPDGTEIFSGAGTANALQSVTITQQVNAGRELTLGSACANMLEATILTPAGRLSIPAGMELTLYKVDEDGVRTKVGLFTAEEPVRPSANMCKITAYDRVSWLDRNLSQWLESLDGWPYTLHDFAKMVCAACNLTLRNEVLPNGDWPVQRFSAGDITGRQLMQWVGEACGRFCRATADGEVELAWYTPKDVVVGQDVGYDIYALRFEDYRVAPIDKVQIRLTESDVGAIYGSGSNGYVITGNCLLASDSEEALQAAAQVIYETLQGVDYTPCSVFISVAAQIEAGDILQVADKNGRTFPVYVMTKIQSGQRAELVCTGSARRDSTTAANHTGFKTLSGKVLELQMGVEGLKLENREADGKMTALETTVDGLQVKVAGQQTGLHEVTDRMSVVEQSASGLTVQVQSIVDDGVAKVSTAAGYTFDETGMTVQKQGREIKTQITEDGMTVYKNGGAVLTANSKGVDAVDLHASTYLIVGGRSRFESLDNDRTACFWIGG